MISTRAARKRTSGEVSYDAISGGVKTRNQLNVKINNNNNNTIIDSEPSLLPPKTKRQRTSSSSSSSSGTTGKAKAATTAAQSKKARALKPVAANVNEQKKTSAKATTATKVKAKTVTKAKATTKTKATDRKSSSSSSNEKKILKKKAGTKIVPCKPKSNDKVSDKSSIDSASSGFVKRSRRRSISVGTVKEEKATTTTSNVSRSLSSFSAQWLSGGSSSQRLKLSGGQKGVEPDDIDARDRNDPNSVTDYVEDMYEHFFRKEEGTSVSRFYMGRPIHGVNDVGKLQPHINENMRCILVDWLIEVHYKFKLFPETLYLTANILDRFLSETEESVVKRDLQLVGVTALLISAKYEEMYVPELRDLTYICDGAYTEAKILRMEENILRTLEYNVTVPTPHTFLVRFLKAAHACKLTQQIANFVLDGTLLSLEHLTCMLRPSQMAAAAVMIARRAIGMLNWSPTLVAYSQYDEEEVIGFARMVLKAKSKLDKNKELMALQKKYSKNKYGKVSHYKFAPIKDPIYDY